MHVKVMHPSHSVHSEVPSGFTLADRLQVAEYEETGFVNGAAKVCFVKSVNTTHLALRLRPPRRWGDIVSHPVVFHADPAQLLTRAQRDAARDEYVRQYNNGYSAGKWGNSELWDSGASPHAWDDGYLDAAAGRAKWHLTYCADHDACGEG